MSLIETVDYAILEKVESTLPGVLKDMGILHGNWTIDTLKRAVQMAPGVYVSFLGGPSDDYKNTKIKAKFDVYLVTKSAIEHYRRDGKKTGSYALLELLIPSLHKLQIPDAGTLKLERVNNLFKESLFNIGGTVYGLTFNIDLYFDPKQSAVDLSKILSFKLNDDVTVIVQ